MDSGRGRQGEGNGGPGCSHAQWGHGGGGGAVYMGLVGWCLDSSSAWPWVLSQEGKVHIDGVSLKSRQQTEGLLRTSVPALAGA